MKIIKHVLIAIIATFVGFLTMKLIAFNDIMLYIMSVLALLSFCYDIGMNLFKCLLAIAENIFEE